MYSFSDVNRANRRSPNRDRYHGITIKSLVACRIDAGSVSVTNILRFSAWFVHWFYGTPPSTQFILMAPNSEYTLSTSIRMRNLQIFSSHFVDHENLDLFHTSFDPLSVSWKSVHPLFAINRRIIAPEKLCSIYFPGGWMTENECNQVAEGSAAGHFIFPRNCIIDCLSCSRCRSFI